MKTAHQTFKDIAPDLMSCPSVRNVLFDPRVLNIARALLGQDLVYYPESVLNYEDRIGPITLAPYAQLHCDAMGMPTDLYQQWQSPTDATYRGYRFGIYIQDYESHSGGLKLCPGTHRGDALSYIREAVEMPVKDTVHIGPHTAEAPQTSFPLYNVPSRPGDLVVWNLRTVHSAGARLLREAPTQAFHPAFEDYIEATWPELLCPIPGPRLTMFFDYAAPAEDIDLYIKSRTAWIEEGGFQKYVAAQYDTPAVVTHAKQQGIRFRFDHLITTLAVGLIGQRFADPQAVGARLLALADQHEEFSPHFPLFDLARYRAVRTQAPDQALQIVLEGVDRHADVTQRLSGETA